jgi:antitoxin HigA-1
MTEPVDHMCRVHPSEILREDFLVPLGLNVNALSLALGVPTTRMHEIVNERRAVTADTARRPARHFGGKTAAWLALQAKCDLKTLPTLRSIERQVLSRHPLAA